jgi:predicted transcriptional regulator of viral defense system
MGKEKYQKQIEELFKRSPVVSFNSIQRIIQSKKNVRQYSKQLIRNLLLGEKIKPLAKGYYSIYDEPLLNVFCFVPSYLGLQDALSIHNLWEQETIPIIITSKKSRPGLRKTKLGNILIRRIDKKYMFGFEYKKIGDFYLPYSDIEKTFIDMVYFKEGMDNDTRNNFKKSINKKKLSRYLKRYPKKFREKVKRNLGF